MFHLRLYAYIFISTRAILDTFPRDRHRRRVVGRTAHLVDVPVGLQIREVADAGVGTHTLYVLIIPQGEGVVVAIGEDDRVAFVLQRHQIVLAEVTTGVAATAVVVVPSLRCHLNGD